MSKSKIRLSISSIHKIESKTFKTVVKHVKSHVEDILSSIDVSNANIKKYNLNSYLKEIGSTITISKSGTRTLTTFLEPIQSFVEVFIPNTIEKPIYANVYAISNKSNSYTLQNPTDTYEIENQTRLKVK